MKLGPFHVLRDGTYKKLSAAYNDFQDLLESALGHDRAPLLDHASLLQHSPLRARVAQSAVLCPDADADPSREAAERVVAAYQRAVAANAVPPVRDMLDAQQRDFVVALTEGRTEAVRLALARMFHTRLVCGLGHVDASHPAILLHPGADALRLQLRLTDTLVSLAEAVGVARVTCPERDPVGRMKPLDVDLYALLGQVEAATGLDVSFPKVGAAYGGWIDGRLVTVDSLAHSHTVLRVQQLGAKSGAQFAEVGGGYGCLACLMYRAGYQNYAMYDMPWVNALQGYFLIMALPPGSVRLFGESESTGSLQVLPYSELDHAAEHSVDLVINTDSLPQLGEVTARKHVAAIHRILRGNFVSVNQETPGDRPHCVVADVVAEHGGFRGVSRHRSWVRTGFVEEVFTRRDAVALAAAA
jgi:hypothetical protein